MDPVALLCWDFVRTEVRTEENKILCSSHGKYHWHTRALTFLTPQSLFRIIAATTRRNLMKSYSSE